MNNYQINIKMKNFYQSHSIITEPLNLSYLFDDVPKKPRIICETLHRFMINSEYPDLYGIKMPNQRKDESYLLFVSKMLERVLQINGSDLFTQRKPLERLFANSRDFAVVLCSILRSKGVPSRVLCGFSSYTSQDSFCPSHWICEYWHEEAGRWVKVDASIDPVLQDYLHMDFDTCDIPEDKYYKSEDVWIECANKQLDDSMFGYDNNSGLGFIRGNLIRNFVSLNKYEVLPWDNLWGFRSRKDITKTEHDKLDDISRVTAGDSDTFNELRTLFETDSSLYAPVRTKLDVRDNNSLDVEYTDDNSSLTIMELNTVKVRDFKPKQSEEIKLDTDKILIEGAAQHNLKNIDISIPKNKLVVFTGVSGSGKSTLVFDTIFAEAQRRFVVGLSPYIRRYMEKTEKPKVDFIYGLSPAIAIEQKTLGNNPRSTVGTITEISDYLRLMYSRIGTPKCMKCGTNICPQTPREIASTLYKNLVLGEEFSLFAPLIINYSGDWSYILEKIQLENISYLRINGKVEKIDQIRPSAGNEKVSVDLVGNTFKIPEDKSNEVAFIEKLTEHIRTLLKEGRGTLTVERSNGERLLFTTNLLCPRCHSSFPEMSSQHFSSNTPLGMCPECGGLGVKQSMEVELLLEDENLSIMDGAIRWFGNLRDTNKTTWPTGPLEPIFNHYNLDIETPWKDLPEWFHKVIFYGSGEEKIKYQSTLGLKETLKPVKGLIPELTRLYYESETENSIKKYRQFMKTVPCQACNGTKLCKEARSVKLRGRTISEIYSLSIDEVLKWVIEVSEYIDDNLLKIGEELITEVYNRLKFLIDVGLHYLTLNRTAPTLSGGEGQRVRLASQLSSGMVGVIYVLDEPSIGLHPHNLINLIKTLMKLRSQDNTVLVVEHEDEIMRNADWIVDIGPKAGILGGKVVAQGTPEEVMNNPASITGKYLSGELKVAVQTKYSERKLTDKWLVLKGAKHNNLKNVTARIPVTAFTCITGVSGSGKSSLIGKTLEPLLEKLLNKSDVEVGEYEEITGYDYFENVINVSQAPIGRTPRSNPATYTDLFNKIRKVFASTDTAKSKGLTQEHFSFNSNKGRCEVCEGQGQIKIEMHFLADVWIPCTECNGKRFKSDILSVKYKGKSIADVLDMDVNEALELFSNNREIVKILQTFCDVGLEYIKIGQSATTLSGGEAQRVKLAKELSRKTNGKMVYILDEPTTGLHFADIQYLLNILHRLITQGHTVIVVEHNLDVIKSADWVIDLGPEGGKEGGEIIAQCSPEELVNYERSYTGQALKKAFQAEINN